MTAPEPAIRICASAAQRSRNIASCTCVGAVRRLHGDEHRERERGREAGEADRRGNRLARLARREDGDHQQQPRCGEQRERRGEREPVDVRLADHGPPSTWLTEVCAVVARRTRGRRRGSATPRGRAGRGRAARRPRARRGAGRAPRRAPPGPTSWWRTPEIARSMYIAASTIAAAPITAQAQPCWKTPARIRNSPAKDVESGTASEMMPIVITIVASAGRPRAIPPSCEKRPVDVRRSTMPASRKRVVEMSAWLTICSTAPSKPRSFVRRRARARSGPTARARST